MRSSFGKNIKVTIYGGSHEAEIGAIVSGLPKDALDFDHAELQRLLDLRAPGNGPFATKRKEPDHFEIKSEDPLELIIKNTDMRPGDYKALADVPRPGHADFTARLRYKGDLNMSGGGPFSGRMTAPLVAAGGVARQWLEKEGVKIGAHIAEIAGIKDASIDPLSPTPDATEGLKPGELAAIDPSARSLMEEAIREAASCGDSVGGIIEVFATGIPPGLGGAMYDGIESVLSPIFFGIPAVKAVEFGAGIDAARKTGSENNDPYILQDGRVATETNNAGGILGGISTGMPLVARLAFKPTPSIAKRQGSVNLKTLKEETLEIKGRHDPCVCVRAVPAVIAATALGIMDIYMEEKE